MERFRGESGHRARTELIREGLMAVSRVHSGDVLFVPSIDDLAKAINKSRGFLYQRIGEGAGQELYIKNLEEASGLKLAHRGLVLAGSLEEIETHGVNWLEIEKAASRLPSQELAGLIGRLARHLANK